MPDYQLTDEELISRFQNGDVRAFDQIIYRFKDRLIIFVYRFLGNQERAEDIVQDTFMKVYTHKHSYREIAKFSTWLYTIAGNLARTELRKMKRRKTYSLSDLSYDDKEYDKWYESLDKFPDETRVYIEDKEVIYLMDDNYIEEKWYG